MINFSDEARRKMTNLLAEEQLKIDELRREKEELEKKLEALNKKFEKMIDRRDAVMDAYGIFIDYVSRTFEMLDNY
jgi:phage shock protein A